MKVPTIYGFEKLPFEVSKSKYSSNKYNPKLDASIIFRFLTNQVPGATYENLLNLMDLYDNLYDNLYDGLLLDRSERAINRFLTSEED